MPPKRSSTIISSMLSLCWKRWSQESEPCRQRKKTLMNVLRKLPKLIDIEHSGQRVALFAGKSRIDGLGCFTSDFIPFGQLIAEFTGELISPAESARRRLGRRRYTLCALNQNWD